MRFGGIGEREGGGRAPPGAVWPSRCKARRQSRSPSRKLAAWQVTGSERTLAADSTALGPDDGAEKEMGAWAMQFAIRVARYRYQVRSELRLNGRRLRGVVPAQTRHRVRTGGVGKRELHAQTADARGNRIRSPQYRWPHQWDPGAPHLRAQSQS